MIEQPDNWDYPLTGWYGRLMREIFRPIKSKRIEVKQLGQIHRIKVEVK